LSISREQTAFAIFELEVQVRQDGDAKAAQQRERRRLTKCKTKRKIFLIKRRFFTFWEKIPADQGD